ncbi:MAG TPA: hypothetical protein P5092_04060 [Ruminococcus sp.]|mgnify:CR=1 FL=1|jgi:hypothetical protein|uniref:hypothetical protein n=1 Tax=Ruminococcus sp. TaxID=41978 RepID=UPI0025CD0263|nr:hypothetical protein [Ruminococcus sp.]HOO07447.1 hypothetical protein [Ruminococcus sp.]HQM01483.1 hypothetical protein [Ruminococcus flavefaciens]HRU96602.1 hypothetical protein [Ruminococcus sp.]
MNSNPFYNQFFNQQYVNPDYYRQSQEQIIQYQQEQSKEVQNVVKAVHDLCDAYKKLDPQHQQQAFYLALAEMAKESGWNSR